MSRDQQKALEAIESFKERALIEESLNEEYKNLLNGVDPGGAADWGYAHDKMKAVALYTLAAIANPAIKSLYPEWLQNDLSPILLEMNRFFDRLSTNARAEADVWQQYAEEYTLEEREIEYLTRKYNEKIDGCRLEAVKAHLAMVPTKKAA